MAPRAIAALSLAVLALSVQCSQKQQDQYASPFEHEGRKLILGSAVTEGGQIKAGTTLAALGDEACFSKQKGSSFLRERLVSVGTTPRNSQRTYRLIVTGDISKKQLEAEAKKDPCVLGISQSVEFTTEDVPDPLIEKQTYVQKLQIMEGQKSFDAAFKDLKQTAVIAMVDSGIDLNHQDLKDNLWINAKEANGQAGVDDDANGYVDDIHGYNIASRKGDPSHETYNDHGTHTSGLAAAVAGNGIGISGLMGRNARLMVLNVIGKNNGADSIFIDEAIRYAADNGADVINISIGGPGEGATTAAAIAYALKKGLVVVTSAGNRAEDISKIFYTPASYASQYPGLITVASIEAVEPSICDNSNFGPTTVKIAAAGCDKTAPKKGILSTRPDNAYGYKNGTSMAAPLVAGAVGYIMGTMKGPNQFAMTPAQVEKILLDRCEPRAELKSLVHGGCQLNLDKLAKGLIH